jgi:hypothetical protein
MFYAIKLTAQYLRFIFFLSLTQWALEEQAAQAIYNNHGTGWKTEVRFPTGAEIHSSPLRRGL